MYGVLIILFILLTAFAVGCFVFIRHESKAVKELKDALNRQKQEEKNAMEIIGKANETKNKLNTGNNTVDFNNGINELHKLAGK